MNPNENDIPNIENIQNTGETANPDNNNAMPVLENNQKYKLDDIYSVNVTVECNINQSCGSIVALSDVIGKYIAWLRIAKGYIKLSTFSTNANIDTQKEEISKGYVSKKIDQFADKDGNTKMNIQISDIYKW